MAQLIEGLIENWPFWLVTVTLIVAAAIDGWQLKVPNWLTFPMILGGWVYSATLSGFPWWEGLMYSLIGTAIGLLLLLPAYAIGGMGAGDVKLMAGIGAWVWTSVTLYAFAFTAVVGGVIALLMIVYRKSWSKHKSQFWMIANEIMTVKDPDKLAAKAAERKPSMLLLPYGIPIAIGTIAYFVMAGKLV